MTAKQPAHTNVYAAFAAAQADFTSPKQSGTNPHFKSRYSTLGDVFAATLPSMEKQGLIFTQLVELMDDKPVLVSIIRHPEDERTIESVMPLEMAGGPQKFGSYITYMRRYAAACMFAVVDGMDDDGNAASAHVDDQAAIIPPTKAPVKRKVTPKKKAPAELEFDKEDHPFDDTLDPDAIDLIDSWVAGHPQLAFDWAVSVSACDNEHEARNSFKKILKDFDDILTTGNRREVFTKYYLRQVEKMDEAAEAEESPR